MAGTIQEGLKDECLALFEKDNARLAALASRMDVLACGDGAQQPNPDWKLRFGQSFVKGVRFQQRSGQLGVPDDLEPSTLTHGGRSTVLDRLTKYERHTNSWLELHEARLSQIERRMDTAERKVEQQEELIRELVASTKASEVCKMSGYCEGAECRSEQLEEIALRTLASVEGKMHSERVLLDELQTRLSGARDAIEALTTRLGAEEQERIVVGLSITELQERLSNLEADLSTCVSEAKLNAEASQQERRTATYDIERRIRHEGVQILCAATEFCELMLASDGVNDTASCQRSKTFSAVSNEVGDEVDGGGFQMGALQGHAAASRSATYDRP